MSNNNNSNQKRNCVHISVASKLTLRASPLILLFKCINAKQTKITTNTKTTFNRLTFLFIYYNNIYYSIDDIFIGLKGPQIIKDNAVESLGLVFGHGRGHLLCLCPICNYEYRNETLCMAHGTAK